MKVILSVPDEGYFEPTWWRLFWAYLMKVILSLPDEGDSYHLTLSLPDEGDSRNSSCTLSLIFMFLLPLVQ